ncbi:Aldehyde reductase 2 [Colletotrichum sidae]|uniref:Aldehyde reductase 2 n=1 Tax=Colletotrichum sidae TaxID=1347389 RepID=A0A4R8T2C5_9PEZI|nr:Aldehyde reductase 2 [Colletotrichum sidae]
MSSTADLAIPKGSTVLVTGANGYLASHTVNEFIKQGYKVRGTVRDVAKNAWLAEYFDKTHGPGSFELVAVPDILAEDAYATAVKGVSAFIHTVVVKTFGPDPREIIPPSVASAEIAIRAAYAEPGVKRFVLTSSSSAAVPTSLEDASNAELRGTVITRDSWVDDIKRRAWSAPEHPPEDFGGVVYGASKMEQEQAVWKYHAEHRAERPDLVVNAVLPNLNFGRVLDVKNQGYPSSAVLPVLLMQGQRSPPQFSIPQYFIDVEDTALLHVAGAVLPDVEGERIFGFGEAFNYDKVLDILRRQNPGRTFHDNYEGSEYLFDVEPRGRAEELLKRVGGHGWTSLEESLLRNTEEVRAASA